MPLFGIICLAREKCKNFLRIKRDTKERYEIYFTSIHLCGLLVPMFLEQFLF